MIKKFIISGADFRNKGSQAMALAVVQGLRNRYPDCRIWVLIPDWGSSGGAFTTLHFDKYLLARLLLGRLKFLVPYSGIAQNEIELGQALQTADLVLDVSGFALSAQFGVGPSLTYILRIALLKKYRRPLVLLPQSFGPFNYNFLAKLVLFPLFKHYLAYPLKIYARERQGYDDLRRFTTANLDQAVDIVLQTETPAPDLLPRENRRSGLTIAGPSAVFIPNSKLLKWNQANDILGLYRNLAEVLKRNGFQIYILRHSSGDLPICELVSHYLHDYQVKLLDCDFNCLELAELLARFNLVITSRYHGLIHAYKAGVPAVVLGWAAKYQEVMRAFDQAAYYFDVRERIDPVSLTNSMKRILSALAQEQQVLRERRPGLIKPDILAIKL